MMRAIQFLVALPFLLSFMILAWFYYTIKQAIIAGIELGKLES